MVMIYHSKLWFLWRFAIAAICFRSFGNRYRIEPPGFSRRFEPRNALGHPGGRKERAVTSPSQNIMVVCSDGKIINNASWWFGTFFIFPYIGKNHPNWLIFFRGIETTNQNCIIYLILVFYFTCCLCRVSSCRACGLTRTPFCIYRTWWWDPAFLVCISSICKW